MKRDVASSTCRNGGRSVPSNRTCTCSRRTSSLFSSHDGFKARRTSSVGGRSVARGIDGRIGGVLLGWHDESRARINFLDYYLLRNQSLSSQLQGNRQQVGQRARIAWYSALLLLTLLHRAKQDLMDIGEESVDTSLMATKDSSADCETDHLRDSSDTTISGHMCT